MDRYIVISSDCHAGLPPERYRDYVDPPLRETFDQALPLQLEMTKKTEESFLIQEINEEWRRGIEDQLTGAWDHDRRLEVLDNDGIAGEIIFPDGITEHNAPPFGAGLSLPTKDIVPELQWGGARAHNRWLAELCSQAPERHAGVAVVPLLWDIDEAIREVKWVKENGLKAVLIPLQTGEFEPYHHRRYDPFWQACEDQGIVVNFHSGAAPMEDFFGKGFPAEMPGEELPGAMGAYVSEVFFWTYRPLTFLIWGGVFERFPKLKVAFTETGMGWMLPPYLRTLDHNYNDVHFSQKLGDFRSHLSMAPTEYFRRNVGIGASCIPRSDVEIRHQLGIDQIMWGSDYPHPEGTWPHTREQMQEVFTGFPDDEVARMLGENAIRFYGFDREKLVPIAQRIGPKKADFLSREPGAESRGARAEGI